MPIMVNSPLIQICKLSYGPALHKAKLISGRQEKGFLMATKSGVKTVLKCLPPSVLLVIGKKMASKTTKST
jgi:hypothetical protein